MWQPRTRHLALVVAVVLSLSACTSTSAAGSARAGGSSAVATAAPTAVALYQLMRRGGVAAKSVHIKGDYTDDGQHLQLDVAGDRSGKTMRLLVNFGSGQIEILKVNGDFYLKADATFWTRLSSAATAKVAAGKYVKVPAGSAAGMGGFRVGTLLTQVFAEDLSSVDKLNATVQRTNLDGVPAYLLTTKVGGDVKIYVSADGGARLLRADDAKSGTLDFTQWDGAAPTSAPPDSQLAQVPIL